jgi:subtilisin family serine protease
MSSSAPLRRGLSLFVFFMIATAAAATAATSVIVELNGEPAAMAAWRARQAGTPMTAAQIESHRAALTTAQNQFLAALAAKGVGYTIGGRSITAVTGHAVRVDFRYTLVYNGVNLLVDPSAIAIIRSMPQVKAVHNDDVLKPLLDVSVPYVRAPQVYGAVKEVSRWDNTREGFEGQGIYISVIDTGVTWSHEMFGGDPTPPRLGIEPAVSGRNEKVVYYMPFADAIEDATGHGTHVASTAAGYLGIAPGRDDLPNTADDVRMHGVAPQARLLSYKVCSDVVSAPGAVGGCVSSAITMAIEDSVSPRTIAGFPKPVAHVINMSLGGAGTPDSPTAVAADNAVRLGTVVVAAGGNDGPDESTVGAPCVGRLVTCVANSLDEHGSWSFDVLAPGAVNKLLPGAVTPAAQLPAASGQRGPVQLWAHSGAPAPPAASVAQYFVYVAGGETPVSYPASVAGRIALVEASLPSTFAQVANSATVAGAIGVIMKSDLANPTAVKTTIPSANLNSADFAYLKSLLSAQTNGALSNYPIRLNPVYNTPTISNSSSRGPVAGYGQVKPDVSAPGTLINAATSPASVIGATGQGFYSSISGTSMASPHVAGAAALVRQAHPTWTPDMIRTALQNTSTNLRNPAGAASSDGGAERVLDQGAGLIDVEAAVNVKALMGVTSTDINAPSLLGSHSFGEVAAINTRRVTTRTQRVTITDVGGSGSYYSLSVRNNRGLDRSGIAVSVSPASVIVPAGGSGTFDVTINIDGNLVTTGAPLQIQWYIRATRSDDGAMISMPFYLRATEQLPPAATLNAIADDGTPDQENGIDRDGRFTLAWAYPSSEPAQPCAYRVEEARGQESGTIWYDDGSEPMTNTGNSKWASALWTTRPHPNTLSTGYSPVYIDESTATITMAQDLALPNALVTLTFDSFEDIEVDFDHGYVDVSTDGGATFTQVAHYTGAFSGIRQVNLSPFAGKTVRLRFRLVSDQLFSFPAAQGWYVDDIRILAGAPFHTVGNVSAPTATLSLGGKQDGTYAYRVVALFNCNAGSPFATTPSNVQTISVSVATRPPTAAFTTTANGTTLTFDASASADQDTIGGAPGIVEYFWSFGDGNTATTTSPVVSHTYGAPGTYRVLLFVTDNDGESASADSEQQVQ